jgi:hypothetical protein
MLVFSANTIPVGLNPNSFSCRPTSASTPCGVNVPSACSTAAADACGFEGDVDAVAVGDLCDRCCDLLRHGVDNVFRAEFGEDPAPFGDRLRDNDAFHTLGTQGEPQADPDRPGTCDECRLVGPDPAPGHGVPARGHRFHERAHLQVDAVGQHVDLVGLDGGERAHPAAGAGDALAGELPAGVIHVVAAGRADPAAVQRPDRHPVTLGDGGDALPHLDHGACELVAEHLEESCPGQLVRPLEIEP